MRQELYVRPCDKRIWEALKAEAAEARMSLSQYVSNILWNHFINNIPTDEEEE